MTGASCLIGRLWLSCRVNQTSRWASKVCLDETSTITGSQISKLPSGTYVAGKQTSWLASSQQQTLSWNTQKTQVIIKWCHLSSRILTYFLFSYNNGLVLMKEKTESVKNTRFLPCQSHQTVSFSIFLFFSFDHPRLSFFLCFEWRDRYTNPHMTNTRLKRGSWTLELWTIIWEEGKRKSRRVCWRQSRWKTKREREAKIRQTEEERTNSTPTGVVNEHEKYMKGLFPRSDGWARLWNTNTSLSLQNISPFTPENTFSPPPLSVSIRQRVLCSLMDITNTHKHHRTM